MLIGCIITYNDWPLIKDCVDSITGKVDKIIIVDGKFKDFPGDDKVSTDGTIKYLSGLDNVELIITTDLNEVEKRNVYIGCLDDGDTVLNLDADEVLIGNISKLESDFGIIDLKDGHSKHIQRRATRFFKFRTGMRYENVHYTLYYNGQMINKLQQVISKDFTSQLIKDFYVLHNWHQRIDLRKHNKSIYYKKLIKNEAGFKR